MYTYFHPRLIVDLTCTVHSMGVNFQFGFFVLCYYLLAVDGLAQTGKSEYVKVQQELSWQQGERDVMMIGGMLMALHQQGPRVGLERRQASTTLLAQGLRNTEEDTQNSLPISTTEPNAIAANSDNCQPLPAGGKAKARGRNERRARPPGSNLGCPLPATPGTEAPESGQQPPTRSNGGDGREGEQVPSRTQQERPLVIPKPFRILTNDGDNPACYDATNGLMPVGVSQSPLHSPQASKYDVFMSRNIDIFPRAWKLIDSQPGTFSLFPHSPHSFLSTQELFM